MTLTPVQVLAQKLVRIKSVTPDDNGCQDIIADLLKDAGFEVVRIFEKAPQIYLQLMDKVIPLPCF